MIFEDTPYLTLEEEKALVMRAQAGDSDAANQLVEAHYKQIYFLSLKMTKKKEWAEDVAQDACLQILTRISQFRAESRFSSWVSTIVVNTALLKHRKEKRIVPKEEIFSPLMPSNEISADDMMINQELLQKTDDFLMHLRDGDQELFVKRFVEGMSLQSISDQTGLSLAALKSRFHRARLKLKGFAEEQGWITHLENHIED